MRKVILIVAVLAALVAGCGTGGNEQGQTVEPKQGHASQEEAPKPEKSTAPAPLDALVGAAVDTGDTDFRVLDLFEADEYFYGAMEMTEKVDTYSRAGKFVTFIYSVRNTADTTKVVSLQADLQAGSETFRESEGVEYPRNSFGRIKLDPREVTTAEFIFDVPTDVKPETLEVKSGGGRDVASVDLTRGNLAEIPPEERMALQWEYTNHDDWANAYELFTEESRQQFTYEQYLRYWESEVSLESTLYEYAFPSVEVSGDTAKITAVYSSHVPADYENYAFRKYCTLVMEHGAWFIQARPDQVKAFAAA